MTELGLGTPALAGPPIALALFLVLSGGRVPRLSRRAWQSAARRAPSHAVTAGLEEAAWRGVVLGGLAVAVGTPAALAASSAGFAAWHRRSLGSRCWIHLLTGVGFGSAFLVGGLAAAILAHGFYNVLVDVAVHGEHVGRLDAS